MQQLEMKRAHDEYDNALLAELKKGKIVEPNEIPPNAVTMNSQIRFTDEYGDAWDYWLVFPEDSDLTKNKISILSPVGCALLGYRVGDKIMFPTPKGKNTMTVEKVLHQPEREGNFDL
jgi:regulator of nucleoside diphosphate kinase